MEYSKTKTRAVKGVFFSFLGSGFARACLFVQTIVLARLLVPHEMGMVQVLTFANLLVLTLSDLGIGMALIRRKELGEETLDTAWCLSAGRGIVLSVILLAASGAIAEFFHLPQLRPWIAVQSLALVFMGFQSIGISLLDKDLMFERRVLLQACSGGILAASTIVSVTLIGGVAGYAVGQVAGSACSAAVSYLFHEYRPGTSFSLRAARQLLGFGAFVTLSGVVMFGFAQGDKAFIGRVFGAGDLGYYGLAYALASLPATAISQVLSSVTFPVYSVLLSDDDGLRRTFLSVARFVSLLGAVVCAVILLYARELVVLLYGPRWLPAVPALQALAVFGYVRGVAGTAGAVFLALGKPHLLFRVSLIALLLLAAAIWPLASRYGTLGVAYAVVGSMIAAQCYGMILASRLMKLRAVDLASAILLPAAGVAAVSCCYLALVQFTAGVPAAILGLAALAVVTVRLVGPQIAQMLRLLMSRETP